MDKQELDALVSAAVILTKLENLDIHPETRNGTPIIETLQKLIGREMRLTSAAPVALPVRLLEEPASVRCDYAHMIVDASGVDVVGIHGCEFAGWLVELINKQRDVPIDQLESCAKCGTAVIRDKAITDEGTGAEAGRTFYYCSEECKARH